MKRLLLTLAAMTLLLTACGQNKKEMKTLVAYFSATGTTEAVAKDLAEVTGATLYEIKPEVKYTAADLNWRDKESRSSVEMQDKNSRPAIVKDLKDADSYDCIFIGFPVWWGTYPQVMFTLFKDINLDGKTVIPFTTHEGSGLANCVEDVKEAFPGANVTKGFAIYGHEVRTGKAKVEKWLKTIEL